ncbi:1523_t:CDS:2 [Racocetra fulgida]|uniref:1523_t:CDS:1 n=1 Tax=Racocetra fulgida TaxID=60492 RepID=A0A9N9A626_9GLOM|nr:1523_t:CDS:2 [Racocetra fulgida]
MEYLEKNELTWEERINLASQLINGLEFLHNQQIVHPILTVFKSNDFENIPYIEPRALTLEKVFAKNSYGKDNSSNIYGAKSNIYSLGVLLWQISSSLKPYESLTPMRMFEHIINGKREEPIVGTPVKYYELYQDCWQDNPDCLIALKKLEHVDVKEIISIYEDTIELDINSYFKPSKSHTAPSLYGGSTVIETLIEDDSNDIQAISQDSQDPNNKFQWNLLKGLRVHGNTFVHGEEILTGDGTITFHKITQPALFYTNKSYNPFERLNNECVSTSKLEEIDMCLHIPLLNIKYGNFKAVDGFLKAIEEVLKNPDQKSVQKVFEKYGDYIAEDVDIGGALRIKSTWPKDRKLIIYDLDILKANLYWINDHIFSGNSNVFGQVPFNNIFTIEDMDGQKITSGHELKAWMEEVYEHKREHVIAFKKIVPTYTLLENKLKQKIFKVCGKLHEVNIEPKIVPHIANSLIPESLNDWIKSEKVALEFLEIPEISLLDKSYMYLRQPFSKKEAFTLANHIRIDDINATAIPFLAESLTNLHPIFYNQHIFNEIHCFIESEKIKLTFNKDKLRPSKKFLEAVDEALNSNYPFRNLKYVFDKFGYFCPRSIILGITFSKVYKSDNNDQHVNDDRIDLNMNRDESRIIEDKLMEWNKSLKYLYEKQNWKTVMQDLIPLYEILPKDRQNDIKSIVSDNYHIVMTGFTKITHSNQTSVNIQFENPLQDNKYEIFGCLVIDEKNVSDVFIRFNLANQYGCRATIHKLDNKRNSRDIKIVYGKKILKGQLPINIEISLPTWLTSCIFVTGFDSKNFNKTQIIKSKLRHYSKTGLNLDVISVQYKSEETRSEMLDNVTMKWCGIDTNGKDHIAVDVGVKTSEFFKWKILGDIITKTIYMTGRVASNINFGNNRSDSNTLKDYGKGAGYMTGKFNDAVAPYIPLFDDAKRLINNIIDLHDAAQYNKNTCARLMERVIDASGAIEKLKRTKKINEKKFNDQNFYNTFQRFTNTLIKIKAFEEELSKMGNFRKTFEASIIKEKFISLTGEFDAIMRDLNFSTSGNETRRKRDVESYYIEK